MARISITDLPPKFQEQAVKQLMEQRARKQRAETLLCPGEDRKEKESKYHNKPTERVTASGNVLKFPSQKEARRYDALLLRLKAGQIKDLRMQVDFTLQEAFTDVEGKRVRAIRYKADFVYRQPAEYYRQMYGSHAAYWNDQSGMPWELVVEDVKSRATATDKYKIKKKLLKEKYGIDIVEV